MNINESLKKKVRRKRAERPKPKSSKVVKIKYTKNTNVLENTYNTTETPQKLPRIIKIENIPAEIPIQFSKDKSLVDKLFNIKNGIIRRKKTCI